MAIVIGNDECLSIKIPGVIHQKEKGSHHIGHMNQIHSPPAEKTGFKIITQTSPRNEVFGKYFQIFALASKNCSWAKNGNIKFIVNRIKNGVFNCVLSSTVLGDRSTRGFFRDWIIGCPACYISRAAMN